MRSAGIDVGSRTIKLVILENGCLVHTAKMENSFDPLLVVRGLLAESQYDVITATGYGRHLVQKYFACELISEIKAFALGAKASINSCRTILDIGGQDTKTISLDENGKLSKFEMNDKCAAGTGRFLEIMAISLGYTLNDFGSVSCSVPKAEKVNSMCTVFAESEVVSLVARGADPAEVALGIHHAVVERAISMLQRVTIKNDLVFVGGVALNPCIKKLLAEKIGKSVHVPDEPQMIGALGCALFGLNSKT